MFLLKKGLLGLGVLSLIYMGGSGTQSSSLLMQGMGFVGLLVGLIVFYVFGRMIWRGLGCFPSFLIFSAIIIFMMYALGMFNNGLAGVGEAFLKFLGHDTGSAAQQQSVEAIENPEEETSVQAFSENFSQEDVVEQPVLPKAMPQSTTQTGSSPDLFGSGTIPAPLGADQPVQENKNGLLENVVSAISGSNKEKQSQPKAFNPNDYPVIYGSVRVINGDTLEIYGKYFKLFGVDAPESNQTCADYRGQSYNCGREAARWLKNWIGENELECHVIQQDTKGNMVGTCSYGAYDIAAALVNAGWAVAYVKYTDIYYPYELQAQENHRGLWQGTFYKPWDWRKIQARKPKIKVLRPKQRKPGLFG